MLASLQFSFNVDEYSLVRKQANRNEVIRFIGALATW